MTLRELIGAAKAKQTYDWDHTADLLAAMYSLHTTGQYRREDFHPTRERVISPLMLDDPAAAYEQLMAEEAKKKSDHRNIPPLANQTRYAEDQSGS